MTLLHLLWGNLVQMKELRISIFTALGGETHEDETDMPPDRNPLEVARQNVKFPQKQHKKKS